LDRADEVDDLLKSVQSLIIPFIRSADEDAAVKSTGHGLQVPGQGPRTVLVGHHPPQKLQSLLGLDLPETGKGKDGLLKTIENVLAYSVNTWDQGFLDKLYASTNAVGLASELLLATLNSNVHVYNVSPALTVIEKETSKRLATVFGLTGPHAGGISQPGGSAANQTSIAIARNTLYPETKVNGIGGHKFILFTSAHGHYSLEKGAQIMGFGSSSVRTVGVDESGRMRADLLDEAVQKSKDAGETPFYVNATAGTTVLGSYDPVDEISKVCKKHNLWLHVDGSWGGLAIFSKKHNYNLKGVELADSIGVTPHKMLNVPLTCSFLLARDLRQVQKAMTLPAGYLFHNSEDEVDEGAGNVSDKSAVDTSTPDAHPGLANEGKEIWDLADLTPQCGRKGESLKMALSWIYNGSDGFERLIDNGFEQAAHLASLISQNDKFTLVSQNPPPCWQVCFYYNKQEGVVHRNKNSKTTEAIAKALVPRGWMIDYAPGEEGKFFRVVTNAQTRRDTVEGLFKAISEVGANIKV